MCKVGTSGGRGLTFEARVCMLAFVRGYTRGLKDFKLEYQVPEAGKFDDVIFDEGGESYHIIQLKHKEHDIKNPQSNSAAKKIVDWIRGKFQYKIKISHSVLFTETYNTDFNLIKYVKAVINVKSSDKFKGKTIKTAVVFTNIDFKMKNGKLDLVVNQRPSAKLWFKGLKSIQLTPLTLQDVDTIVDCSNWCPDVKFYKFDKNPDIVKILKRQAFTLALSNWDSKYSDDVKNDLRDLTKISEDEIRDALQHIIFAVRQPNDKELKDVIKVQLKEHFKLHNASIIYNELAELFRGWCDTKDPLEQPSTSYQPNKQQVLTYADAERIFQKNVKVVSFGVTAPTASFTGRKKELEEIRKKLNEESNVIITQSLTISGLGGIGKTQLTKQFIKEFGQSEFYGRVIWIEAESDESVAKSFRQIAQKINIENARNKDTEVVIDEVFEYFEGFKVLFVFDNFDKSPVNEGSLVSHCKKSASNSTNISRPFFLFTSRNREILRGVPLLNLDVLSPDDAVHFIERDLKEISHTREDAEKLAKRLQCFPLAMQQSIAFMKEQQKKLKVFGETYKIQDYFEKFEKGTQALLNFEYSDEFGDFGKTTFITWNVTLDAIETDEKNGENAIKVLKMLAYLYADKIDSKMFLPFFEEDNEKTASAVLLLEKYSMITKLEQNGSKYQIHRLVQAVIQLKFKEDEESLLEQTMHLVYPELLKEYHSNKRYKLNDLTKKCSAEQIIHFKNLELHSNKHKVLKEKYEDLFEYLLQDQFLWHATLDDDVEKFKALVASEEKFQNYIKKRDDILISFLSKFQSNKIIKYLIENDFLGLNDQVWESSFFNESFIDLSMDENNVDLFKYLVEKGANLSKILKFASVNLIDEIRNGKTDSIQNLMENYSEDNFKTLEECLFYATVLNQESIVDVLLKNNIKPCFELKNCSPLFWSPLFVAVKLNYSDILKIFVRFCDKEDFKKCLFQLAKDVSFTDKTWFEKVFNEYLQKGGAVNGQDEEGNTILYWAIRDLHKNIKKLEIIHFLLDSGADPTVANNYGENALANILEAYESSLNSWTNDKHIVSEIKKLLDKIISSISTPDKFIGAVANGLCQVSNWTREKEFLKMFDQLLKQIGDINVQNEKGETVLIEYCQTPDCKVENVKFLLEKGADVNAIDNYGDSALYHSVGLRFDHVFEYLLPKVKSVDENVLFNAIKHKKLGIVKILFEKHFPPDHKFSDGKTLFEVAMEFVSPCVCVMKPQFIEYLEQGGDINKRDKNGNTLLIKLVRAIRWKGYCDIDDVKFLVERGIDVNATNNEEECALYWAVWLKKDDIFLYLFDKVSSVDENVLFYAIFWKKLSIVKSLIPKHFQKDYRFINLKGWEKYFNNCTPLEVEIKEKRKDVENYLKNL